MWGGEQMTNKCPCGRTKSNLVERHTQFFKDYCSYYCSIYYQNPSAHPPVKLSDSKHHSNHYRNPDIMVNCEMCNQEYPIRDNSKLSNQMFCGVDCYRELMQGKYSMRDWRVLKMIDFHPNCNTNYIANNWQDNNLKLSSIGASQILRIYAARGIVTRITTDQNKYIYRISDAFRASNYTLGQAVKGKIRL